MGATVVVGTCARLQRLASSGFETAKTALPAGYVPPEGAICTVHLGCYAERSCSHPPPAIPATVSNPPNIMSGLEAGIRVALIGTILASHALVRLRYTGGRGTRGAGLLELRAW